MKKLSLLLFFMFPVFLVSCQNSLNVTTETLTDERSEEIAQTLKFAPITISQLRSAQSASLGIVNLELGKKSTNCESGFGICKAVWFPGLSEWWKDITGTRSINGQEDDDNRGIEGLIVTDNENREFIELRLSEAPKNFSLEELKMVVEDFVVMPNSGENAFKPGKVIRPGKYEFSPNIGEYGGYRIPILGEDEL